MPSSSGKDDEDRPVTRSDRGTSATTITWLGHSTVLLELDGTRLLTDPLLRSRVGPLVRIAPHGSPRVPRELDGVVLAARAEAPLVGLTADRSLVDTDSRYVRATLQSAQQDPVVTDCGDGTGATTTEAIGGVASAGKRNAKHDATSGKSESEQDRRKSRVEETTQHLQLF